MNSLAAATVYVAVKPELSYQNETKNKDNAKVPLASFDT